MEVKFTGDVFSFVVCEDTEEVEIALGNRATNASPVKYTYYWENGGGFVSLPQELSGSDAMWAPEVIYDEEDGLYYAFFTLNPPADKAVEASSAPMYMPMVATSEKASGPFVPVTFDDRNTSYPQFYYYAGVAAASQAKQSPIESQKALLFEKAIYYYNRALELSSTYTNAYYGLGVIYYFELGDADTGLEYALKAIGADPDQFGARYMAARIYVEKGDNAKAIEQYNYIIRHADKETAASAVRNKEILESDG